jgi:hypothetical protein
MGRETLPESCVAVASIRVDAFDATSGRVLRPLPLRYPDSLSGFRPF